MKRLQTKCFIVSAAMHSSLLLLLFVAPAFFLSDKKPVNLPTLDLIPSKAVDDLMSGGGNPAATLPPAPKIEVAPPQPPPPKIEVQPPPEPEPVRPEPKVVQPPKQVEPEPVAPLPKKTEPDPTSTRPKKKETPPKSTQTDTTEKPKKRESRPSFKLASETPSKALLAAKAQAQAQAEARAKAAQAEYLARLKRIGESLGRNLSSGTDIEVPGPGGEAYANYRQIVESRYRNEWIPPSDLADDSATARVEVVIARNGKVISARITQRSGVPALDKSVDRTLRAIDFIAPFPEGAKDLKRSFNIGFNLKSKRLSG